MKFKSLLVLFVIFSSLSSYGDSGVGDFYGYFDGRLSTQKLRENLSGKISFKTKSAYSYNSLAGRFADDETEIKQNLETVVLDISKGNLTSVSEVDLNRLSNTESYLNRFRNELVESEILDDSSLAYFDEVLKTKKMLLMTEFKDCNNADFNLDVSEDEENGIMGSMAKVNAIILICDAPLVTFLNTKNESIISLPGVADLYEYEYRKKFLLEISAYRVSADFQTPNLVERMISQWDYSREEAENELDTMRRLNGKVIYSITDSVINSGITAERVYTENRPDHAVQRAHDLAVERAANQVLQFVDAMNIVDYTGFILGDLML